MEIKIITTIVIISLSFVALALLPVNKVIDGFVHLFENQPSKEYPQIENFLEYVTETWMEDDALFHKSLWNHYENRGPRTNNHVEGYNAKLKRFLSKHPNIWTFILKIKGEESNSALRFTHLEAGTLKERGRKASNLENDLAILQLKNKYVLHEIELGDYLMELTEFCKEFDQ